ncbi:hypothetical protein BMS3Abin02_00336 [bacterium BMS3Abin02]|nr:hypothetical protein BMS3Abin02_00336 [bacterium BMS3Abin02]GBE21351.1 hypothetical protein BMS3Bbin01_00693 [bacterium BMS3Bbin01]
MRHVPHLCLEPPWDGPTVSVSEAARHHLYDVLRITDGARGLLYGRQGKDR